MKTTHHTETAIQIISDELELQRDLFAGRNPPTPLECLALSIRHDQLIAALGRLRRHVADVKGGPP